MGQHAVVAAMEGDGAPPQLTVVTDDVTRQFLTTHHRPFSSTVWGGGVPVTPARPVIATGLWRDHPRTQPIQLATALECRDQHTMFFWEAVITLSLLDAVWKPRHVMYLQAIVPILAISHFWRGSPRWQLYGLHATLIVYNLDLFVDLRWL